MLICRISALLRTAPFLWVFTGLWTLQTAIAQPVVSIASRAGCEQAEIEVPVEVQNFTDVGTFTFYITLDTSQLAFVQVFDLNPALSTGNLVANLCNLDQPAICVNWFSMTPVNLTEDTLFQLKVFLREGSSVMAFHPDSEVGRSDLTLYKNVSFHSGILLPFGPLIPEPSMIQVSEGSPAQFALPSFPGTAYNWQIFQDDQWIDASGNASFSGAKSPELLILQTPLGLHNARFRCQLVQPGCISTSEEASLQVSGTGIADLRFEQKGKLLVSPNPAYDKISCESSVYVPKGLLILSDTRGATVLSRNVTNLLAKNSIFLNIENLAPGVYTLSLWASTAKFDPVKVLIEKQ